MRKRTSRAFLPEDLVLPGDNMAGEQSLRIRLIRDRHRTIRIIVKPDQTVLLKAPIYAQQGDIIRAALYRKNWIQAKLAHFAALPPPAHHGYVPGEVFWHGGEAFSLSLRELPGTSRRLPLARLDGANLLVEGCTLSPERIKKAIAQWRKQEAETLLTNRLEQLHDHTCQVLGDELALPTLRLRAFKRRWGSCSARGEITLALQLCALPPELVDYVIIHELCHLRRFDHSPTFTRLLATIVPDCKIREQRLKNWRLDQVRD